MNPFQPPSAFVNSGPESFISLKQHEQDYYTQSRYLDQPSPPPPKTPIRTPVMGTRTYQHRRTLSNASSQYSSRGGQVDDYGEERNPPEVDYRLINFNISGAIEREPLQFHSVPYSCNHPDTSNAHPIPNRMRLYENVSHFQHHMHGASPQKATRAQTPINQEFEKSTTMTNSMRREMFFSSDPNPAAFTVCTTNGNDHNPTSEACTYSTTKVSGSTGCTPQDSFSDDSSYLSALSSQNRIRFSPDNFLEDSSTLSPTSRIAVANLQRAIVRRTMELEEVEKS